MLYNIVRLVSSVSACEFVCVCKIEACAVFVILSVFVTVVIWLIGYSVT